MPGALKSWSDIRHKFDLLPQERRAAFALACAEHLVGLTATARTAELRSILDEGWAALSSSQIDPAAVQRLVDSEDADEDEVAAVAYALGAVSGQPMDAWCAVMRCVDAAFDRVPYPEGTTTFRPLEIDAATTEVLEERSWQVTALNVLKEPVNLTGLASRLRALS